MRARHITNTMDSQADSERTPAGKERGGNQTGFTETVGSEAALAWPGLTYPMCEPRVHHHDIAGFAEDLVWFAIRNAGAGQRWQLLLVRGLEGGKTAVTGRRST